MTRLAEVTESTGSTRLTGMYRGGIPLCVPVTLLTIVASKLTIY